MSDGSGTDTQPLDFFRALWPATGHYCIALKSPKGMRQTFFERIEDAAAFALLADARGIETYMGCASYKDASSRKAENVAAVKAFWMDIDVGEGKPYANPRHAFDAVQQFVNGALLPSPSFVFSGSGWHLYWLLQRELLPSEWKPRAEALKARASALGLAADPSRTGDIASILRPVGTHNHKRGDARDVVAGPFSFSSLEEIDKALGITPIVSNAADNTKFQVTSNSPGEPSYGTVIAEQCAQLRNFRDRRGQLPEPEWYAGLGVLAHCADGEQLAHEWSAGDPRYSHSDTQRKLEHARSAAGPSTCGRLQSLNPGACMGCPHFGKITSPIVLGRREAAPAFPFEQPKSEFAALPFPFKWGKTHAIEIKDADEEGNVIWRTIYKAPLFLSHTRRHELSNQQSLAFQHWLPHEGWHEVLLPWDDQSPKTVVNRLGAQGVNIHAANVKDMHFYIKTAIDDFQAHRKVDMEYAQFGWKGDFEGFLLGDELFTPGKVERVGVSQELAQRTQWMKPYGTFEAWRAAANQLFAFERQGLMVLAGFASVLMAFAQEAGGLIVAAVSEEGGKGKTLGLRGAQTAWGSDNVTAITKTDTVNSRFKLISLLGGLPVTWDEMRDRDPEIVKDFVLTFSGGRDKNRLDKNASLRQNGRNWSTMLIATSNISVSELVSHDGETAQQARILETVFEDLTGVKASDGKDIERQLLANRGHAGRRFIQALMIPGMIDWCRHAVPTYAREYEQKLGAHKTVLRFYTNGLACFKAAGEILNRAGILEFSTERVLQYAVDVASGMGGKLIDPRSDHIYMLTQFINQSWANALVVQDAWKPKQETLPQKMPIAALAIRYEKTPGKVYIDRSFLKDWCVKKRVMFSNLAQKCQAGGVLLNDAKRINLGAGTVYAAAGQVNAWEVAAEMLPGLQELEGTDNVVRMR